MRKQWLRFMEVTHAKSTENIQAARFWGRIDSVFNYTKILFTIVTMILAYTKVPWFWVGLFATLSAVAAIVYSFLRPGDRRSKLAETSRVFRSLLMRMAKATTKEKFDYLWDELNKAITEKSIATTAVTKDVGAEWAMTPQMLACVEDEESKEMAKRVSYVGEKIPNRRHSFKAKFKSAKPVFKANKKSSSSDQNHVPASPIVHSSPAKVSSNDEEDVFEESYVSVEKVVTTDGDMSDSSQVEDSTTVEIEVVQPEVKVNIEEADDSKNFDINMEEVPLIDGDKPTVVE